MTTPSDLWENDPYLVPMTPERQQRIEEITFALLQSDGGDPALRLDPAALARYQQWLRDMADEG